jgi:ADP-ribose pyrophosphatase
METLLKCRKFEIFQQSFSAKDGRRMARQFVVHPGAVVVLPLLDDARCLLIRQFRHGIGREIWELPAGTLDVPGESAADAAVRELEEECGYRAGRVERLCEFYTSPGIMTELITAFVARNLTRTQQNLGPNEEIVVELSTLPEAMAMIHAGKIIDAKTMVTLMWWDTHRKGSA